MLHCPVFPTNCFKQGSPKKVGRAYTENSIRTIHQNGLSTQKNVGTLFANRAHFAARDSQSDTKPVPRTSCNQSENEYAHTKLTAMPVHAVVSVAVANIFAGTACCGTVDYGLFTTHGQPACLLVVKPHVFVPVRCVCCLESVHVCKHWSFSALNRCAERSRAERLIVKMFSSLVRWLGYDVGVQPHISGLTAVRTQKSAVGISLVNFPLMYSAVGATVAQRLARSPLTKANRAQYPAGSPDFRKWESYRTMPLVGGPFLGDPPASPAPSFRRRSILSPIILIGSQDFAVKSRPNFFIHSLVCRNKSRYLGELLGRVHTCGQCPRGAAKAFHEGLTYMYQCTRRCGAAALPRVHRACSCRKSAPRGLGLYVSVHTSLRRRCSTARPPSAQLPQKRSTRAWLICISAHVAAAPLQYRASTERAVAAKALHEGLAYMYQRAQLRRRRGLCPHIRWSYKGLTVTHYKSSIVTTCKGSELACSFLVVLLVPVGSAPFRTRLQFTSDCLAVGNVLSDKWHENHQGLRQENSARVGQQNRMEQRQRAARTPAVKPERLKHRVGSAVNRRSRRLQRSEGRYLSALLSLQLCDPQVQRV
ncbi:hypothetical protein PR048_031682 [Dryococelus australis]|uniref:Uncharacterized protein n=1 Tax=Dryococelus australis TaxID=614101 RepID=A0ABQ9G5Z3_9NEOP|nr:hypothetical protein PR048_031682 [Dryococelus australis]